MLPAGPRLPDKRRSLQVPACRGSPVTVLAPEWEGGPRPAEANTCPLPARALEGRPWGLCQGAETMAWEGCWARARGAQQAQGWQQALPWGRGWVVSLASSPDPVPGCQLPPGVGTGHRL